MNYLLASNNAVLKFPYSLEELRSDNPQTSFPLEMSAEELAEWGVYSVEEQNPPAYNEQTESIELQSPSLVNGVWIREFKVTAAKLIDIEKRTLELSTSIKIERNRILSCSDYTQLADAAISKIYLVEITRFRQALRDVPQQPGFPWSVKWPVLAEEDKP